MRFPISTLESPTDPVIYRSKLNAKINRNFQVFTPTDFLAAITQHIASALFRRCNRSASVMGIDPERLRQRTSVAPSCLKVQGKPLPSNNVCIFTSFDPSIPKWHRPLSPSQTGRGGSERG